MNFPLLDVCKVICIGTEPESPIYQFGAFHILSYTGNFKIHLSALIRNTLRNIWQKVQCFYLKIITLFLIFC